MTDNDGPETEAPFSADVIERIAERTGVSTDDLGAALTELNASLIGRHSELEREGEYVTVDERRAYRVDASWWDDTLAAFDVEEGLADAVRATHTERARLAFEHSVEGDERFGDDEGVVIRVDTAEQF
ncbi:hypothetical protein [Halobaculum gomorrense]|uniref:DUF8048 domain-containing protein n=1 Tax=Halobaculum gomorrense TaxID=43928 RepID=A0A1M5KBG2_9EURY|nr:hypothetical protein [Halobaculum gomorrense]SHG50196.1 hypothetical protein SAMN05443636_0448 [Halobaculum gomorrense]